MFYNIIGEIVRLNARFIAGTIYIPIHLIIKRPQRTQLKQELTISKWYNSNKQRSVQRISEYPNKARVIKNERIWKRKKKAMSYMRWLSRNDSMIYTRVNCWQGFTLYLGAPVV